MWQDVIDRPDGQHDEGERRTGRDAYSLTA